MLVNDGSETQWSASDGELMTGFGRFMRKTGVDEVPQLFNVLRGEMSLVGPRPERPHFADLFGIEVDGYDDRLRVPVGITGWAQVHGLRGDSSISQRAAFDNGYIEHWSLWRDIVILARTAKTVVRGGGG
jgi:lipopolysaccharide/colanic/teichoic acid biosynthesis glycosyltransferase